MNKDNMINNALEEGVVDFVFVFQLLGIVEREHDRHSNFEINFSYLKSLTADFIIELVEKKFFTPNHLADNESGLEPWAGTINELKIYLHSDFVNNNTYTKYDSSLIGGIITLLITDYGEKYILEKIKNGEHENGLDN
jgi:hypothetical protein